MIVAEGNFFDIAAADMEEIDNFMKDFQKWEWEIQEVKPSAAKFSIEENYLVENAVFDIEPREIKFLKLCKTRKN